MPRRRVQREQCDCLDCREGFPADTLLGTAVARQQPPPKCLVLYLRSPNRNPNASDSAQSRTPCLDAVVDEGCSAILALREGRQSDLQDLENLFCCIPVLNKVEGKGAEERGTVLRNLSASFASECASSRALAMSAGFSSVHNLGAFYLTPGEEVVTAASCKIAQLLGLQGLKPLEAPTAKKTALNDNETDLLFIALDGSQGSTQAAQLQFAEDLVSTLSRDAIFHSSVLLVLLQNREDPAGQRMQAGEDLKVVQGYSAVKVPRQSFEFACLDEVTTSGTACIYSVQRLPYVIRRDSLTRFPSDLEHENLGERCILAERLLPTLAYKLGCAPKYGA